jgi:predicted RecB family endonuclease
MNIAGKKMELIEWLVRLQDENLIQRIENLKNDARKDIFEKRIPKTIEELQSKLEQSENDIFSGRIHSQEEVENYFKAKFGK